MVEVPNSEQKREGKSSKGRFVTNPSHSSRPRQQCQQKNTSYLSWLIKHLYYHCPHEKLAIPAPGAPSVRPVALQGSAGRAGCAREALVLTGRVGNRSPAVLAQRPLLGARCWQLGGAQCWGHGLQTKHCSQHTLTPPGTLHCKDNGCFSTLPPTPPRSLDFFHPYNAKNENFF